MPFALVKYQVLGGLILTSRPKARLFLTEWLSCYFHLGQSLNILIVKTN